MNKPNVKKLLNSKWTAVKPVQKEKHFLVTKVETNESGIVESLTLEAIMSGRESVLDWRELENDGLWRQGWK